MDITLYFLRSSEQRIVTDMLHYAVSLDSLGKSLNDYPHLSAYDRHYGFTGTDLGLYALKGHELAGAAWIRLLKKHEALESYIDEATPVLTMAVKPQFRGQGIGTAMLEQLIAEAGALYGGLAASARSDSAAMRLYERCGFVSVSGSERRSLVDGSEWVTFSLTLQRREAKRILERHDPRRWMD